MNESFLQDMLNGLKASPKYLSSKYLYDANGDKLYQEKMKTPEYYLTNCEYEILSQHSDIIRQSICKDSSPIQLIELGAGDGYKTKLLLDNLLKHKSISTYFPIDISDNILEELTNSLKQSHPELRVVSVHGDYFSGLQSIISGKNNVKNVVLFLGSTIGNLWPEEEIDFFGKLAGYLNPGDVLITGFDLKKSPKMVKDAYTLGPNEAFYKNILIRIKNELGANLDPADFEHFFYYCPISGLAKTFLLSTKDLTIRFKETDEIVFLTAWEPIQISLHRKYDEQRIQYIAENSGFTVEKNFFDSKNYFVNSMWSLVG